VDSGGRKSIFEINKGLHLQGGDIMRDNTKIQRSAILGDQYRWNGYVPYVLNETLTMNDKGVILRAFEQLRLKACVDFKPRTMEEGYISVESLTGCWSDIGKRGGPQQLSIGEGCGYIGIVEHEFLHALGFFHEQSRYDRDNYVTINFENIIPEYVSNFDKVSALESTTQGTPYDYTSLMHYGQNDFTNGNGSIIITKDPRFQDVIGQRYDLSPIDALELNMLYQCSVPDMSMISNSSGPSYFMYFSTESRQEGDSGRLESKIMVPRRDCHAQCLQFFYYHSGNETDQLNIWIREYESYTDIVGTLRLMDHISGPPTNHWQLHHVPLNAEKPFLVEFEGRKGAGYSRGGFSVDDINLSESECPQVWQIQNFMELWNKSAPGTDIFSPLYYSPEGYHYQVYLKLNQDSLSSYVRLVSGVYDDQLQWPCSWRQVTVTLLDQTPNMQQRMSAEASITTDPTEIWEGKYLWDKPSKVGLTEVTADNETIYVSQSKGYITFMEKARLSDREFVKGGDLILLISMQDISALQLSNSLPCPNATVKDINAPYYQGAQEGSCTPRIIYPTPTLPRELSHLSWSQTSALQDVDSDGMKSIFEINKEYVSNFNKVSALKSTTQGTPYDYTSLMHYSQNDFTNGNVSIIITKDPRFQDVIGQRYDLSPIDALELNKLYQCTESISFLDHCSFDCNMCEMATCSSTGNGWQREISASGGPFSDHSSLKTIGLSYFMYFSTESGQEGDSGRLESKKMIPRRNCHAQCLQFFYYHSGNETDQLNIWIREYKSYTDTVGTLRLMDHISGPPTNHWQLHHVLLNANKPFLVEFEGRKGAGYSRGGFSVDDINLSESECPQVWQIQNFMELWNKSAPGTDIFSPLYYSPDGYRYQVLLRLSQTSVSIYLRLVSGVYDDQLQWPCPWRQVTFVLLDQTPNMQQRMSREKSFTTDPSKMLGGKYFWGKPSEVGTPAIINGTEKVNATGGWGYMNFLDIAYLDDRAFVKGGDLIILLSMQGGF
ncbi:hypothetical protein NFI96_034285, partial [Prochilodus magdalenae]